MGLVFLGPAEDTRSGGRHAGGNLPRIGPRHLGESTHCEGHQVGRIGPAAVRHRSQERGIRLDEELVKRYRVT